jgi:ribosome-binding protein aMBF1 (putative translation factor)
VDSQALLQAGRQRQWVAVRAQLIDLAREWSGISTKELGRRLHRDASMISRLYGRYQGHRDKQTEERLAGELAK